MRYRDAKNLQNGDEVIRKEDKAILTVKSVEAYGQYKIVKIFCVEEGGALVSLTQEQVD